jgi:outer membrane lipoprotein carrier protein
MFRANRSLLFALILTCAPLVARAASADPEPATTQELIQAVESTYQGVESLQADFVQVTRSATLGEEQRQKGRVVLKRPRKMRWDFTSPNSKLFVTDGSTMWIWSPADNQVIVYKDLSQAAPGVAGLLSDLNGIDEKFQVQVIDGTTDPNARSYTIELRPREQAGFKVLRLSVSKKKYVVERVVITDQFDNITDLSFSQVKLNQRISDGDFSFSVPAGAEVIQPGDF